MISLPDLSISGELTDWHNLLQGALGSVVGSALGVFGAYLAARYTITKQLASDRVLAQEASGTAAAREVAILVNKSEKALLQMATVAYADPGKLDEAWNELSTSNMSMIDARDVIHSDLPPHLVDVLNELDVRTFALFEYFVLRESIPDDWGAGVARREKLPPVGRAAMYAHDQTVIARSKLSSYRRDPLGATEVWDKEAQKLAKRNKRSAKRRQQTS